MPRAGHRARRVTRLGRIVVVGASLAGLRAAEGLRAEGFDGELFVVGEEPHMPYNRPPLSKELLAGSVAPDDVRLQAVGELACEWVLGEAAVALDLAARRIALSGGSELPFDGLVLACGAAARPFAGPVPGAGVHTLRSLGDALELARALPAAEHVAVVGAGFIGCEVAATARKHGARVTMIDVADAPLGPRLGSMVSAWFTELHTAAGVVLEMGQGVAALEGGDRLERVRLADGRALDADLAVVGLGSVPNTHWLEGSGIPLDGGVVCDASLAVRGVPDVVAAGDVARWPYAPLGAPVRIEHWSNAVEQGGFAARTLLHGAQVAGPFVSVPSFWTDQHDVRVQSLGLPAAADRSVLAEGSPEDGAFVVAYARGERLIGAVGVGLPRRLARLRKAIARGDSIDAVLAHAAG
jgi:3-phenylpropionate/trans-cinnamate dioxygenase ferredoxin reductase component